MKIKDETCYDEQTLTKVYHALERQGIKQKKAEEIVSEILSAGVLFRERVWA